MIYKLNLKHLRKGVFTICDVRLGGGTAVMSQHDSPPARSPLRRFMDVGPTGSCKWDYVVVSL